MSSREFDLTGYASRVRGGRRRGTRLLFLIGLAFALGGVAVLASISYETGYPSLEVSVIILGIFVGVGGLFFWAPILFVRPWDAPKSLRIDATGFELRLGSGRTIRHTWDEEGLAVDIRQPVLDASSRPMPPGEGLLMIPGGDSGSIPREAREILLAEGRRHGLAYLEEQYRGIIPTTQEAPVMIVRRVVARLPFGAVPPTNAWPFPEPTAQLTSFDLAKGKYRSDALGLDSPTKAGTLIVGAAGIRVALANGKEQRFAFSDPKFRLGFGCRLESAVTPLDAPGGLWFISFGRVESGYFVSGAARTAVVRAAQTAGLDVRSSNGSLPDRPIWRWVADTRIQAPDHKLAGLAPPDSTNT